MEFGLTQAFDLGSRVDSLHPHTLRMTDAQANSYIL